ncbi:MAG: VOC family protein [Candidatus Thorarchaeota archaeon]
MTTEKPKIRRVYFQVKVDDLIRARDFYTNTFDFDVSFFISPEVGWCEIQLPGEARLGLNLRGKDEKKSLNYGILTLEVEDLQAGWNYFKDKGLKPTEIVDVPQMVSYFNIKDSEGNTIQIVGEPRINS